MATRSFLQLDPVLGPLLRTYLRDIDHWETDDVNPPVAVFVPALTATEQVIFADLQTMARFGVTLTLAEWQSVKGDAAALRTYLGVGSPTAAQTAAATKAIIRVLGTIVRS